MKSLRKNAHEKRKEKRELVRTYARTRARRAGQDPKTTPPGQALSAFAASPDIENPKTRLDNKTVKLICLSLHAQAQEQCQA